MLLKTFETFKNEPNIKDYAWLYFLVFPYKGKMTKKSWQNDDRMGTPIETSFENFNNLIQITDTEYIANENAKKEVLKCFYKKDIKDAFNLAISLKEYETKAYPISKIPIELWLEYSPIKNAIDEWYDELFVDWWNTEGNTRIVDKYIKKREKKLDLINEYQIRLYYFPEQIPVKVIIYRGIKNEYNPEYYKRYSSWTLDKEQGIRFAKWNFVKGYSPKGNESNTQYLLEKEIELKDILIFIGGEEHEIIMKEPVKIDKITKIK